MQYKKCTPEEIAQMKAMRLEGKSFEEIGRKFNKSYVTAMYHTDDRQCKRIQEGAKRQRIENREAYNEYHRRYEKEHPRKKKV